MVSKIKGPRNYLSCCHVLTAMGRGRRGIIPERKLGCQAPSIRTGPRPSPSLGHPRPQPSGSQGLAWKAGTAGGAWSGSAQPLSPSPPQALEGGVLPVLLTAEGLWGLGPWAERGVKASHSSQPLCRGRWWFPNTQFQGQGQVKRTV